MKHLDENDVDVDGVAHRGGDEGAKPLATARERIAMTPEISEERFRLLAEKSTDPMFIIDLSTTSIVYVSPSIERLTGYRPDELAGQIPANLPTRPDPGQIADGLARLQRDGEVEGFVLDVMRKDGSKALVEVNATIVGLETESVQVQGVVRDITQRRALDDRLRQQQKMEALGTLAGGIAHDFNNLLTGILGGASLLKRCATNTERVVQTAEVIERASIRASELTQHLLGFARPSTASYSAVNLHRIIEEVVALLGRTLDRQVEIVQRLRAHPPVVNGDAAQLQQVVLNLVVNASDAMPKGGKIVIDTKTVDVSEEDARSHPALIQGTHVVLCVEDTGVGMSEGVLQRIFEPFFTTKEDLGRSGLGLAMVYGIVASQSGDLRVKSEPGQGTTFEVFLQCASSVEEAPIDCSGGPVQGLGRLLVVDDEQVVREAAGVILPELGYEITCAQDGREAVKLYTDNWQELDLVILDLTMPFMGGVECFHALRQINPRVRVLLSTGHTFDAEAQALLDDGVIDFIQKPYTMRQLAEKVSKALLQ